MAIVRLGGERFVDTTTGKTFSTTGGGYFSGGSTQLSPPVDPIPQVPEQATPQPGSETTPQPDVKAATPDIIQINEEAVDVEVMLRLLFENLVGTELLSFSRHDLIDGIDARYQQISNLSKIDAVSGPSTLINLSNTIEQIFKNYQLRRYQNVPYATADPSGLNNHVYLDDSGSICIELNGLLPNMQIEIEFKSADTNDIMY
jgi:hypothetical protein